MKYITFVKNREESEKVQKVLFAAGKRWGDGKVLRYQDKNFISVNFECLGYVDSFEFVAETLMDKHFNFKAVDSGRVSDVFPALHHDKLIEVDGKKWSGSTLKEMIKRYANEDGDEFKEVRF